MAWRLWQGFLWAGSGLSAACFFLFRQSYNWCHLKLDRYKLHRRLAKYEREVVTPEARQPEEPRLRDLNQGLLLTDFDQTPETFFPLLPERTAVQKGSKIPPPPKVAPPATAFRYWTPADSAPSKACSLSFAGLPLSSGSKQAPSKRPAKPPELLYC